MTWQSVSLLSLDFAEKWIFDEGENKILEGTLISKQAFPTKFKQLQNCYTIEDSKGIVWTLWGKTVIDRNMKNIQEGSKIRIEYIGTKQNPKTGNSYKDFSIEIWTD